jgi:hypothetical protein
MGFETLWHAEKHNKMMNLSKVKGKGNPVTGPGGSIG